MVALDLPIEGAASSTVEVDDGRRFLIGAVMTGVATAIRFVSMAIALSRAEFSGTFFVLPVVAGLFVFFVNQYDRTRASAATAAGEDPPFALWPIAFIAVLWTTVALVAFGIYSYS